MNKTVAERYADKLVGEWASSTRKALEHTDPMEHLETKGNILISASGLPEFSFDMLPAIHAEVTEKVREMWCNTHDLGDYPMVGYVLDTGGRPQLMMWVRLTPRKPVLRERRGQRCGQ